MPTALQSTISQLAAGFAEQVLEAFRGMRLEELLAASGEAPRSGRPGRPPKATTAMAAAPAGPRPARPARRGRLGRRSADDIQGTIERVVGLLKQHKEGLRSEQIQAQLGVDKRELPRPIAHALASKKIKKKGQRRSTTYFAA